MIITYYLNNAEKAAALKLAAALDIDVREVNEAMVADDYDLVTTGLYIHGDGAVDFVIRYDAGFVCSIMNILTKHASKIKQAYAIVESGFGLLVSLFQDIETDVEAVMHERAMAAEKKQIEDELEAKMLNYKRKEYDTLMANGNSHEDAMKVLFILYGHEVISPNK